MFVMMLSSSRPPRATSEAARATAEAAFTESHTLTPTGRAGRTGPSVSIVPGSVSHHDLMIIVVMGNYYWCLDIITG